MQWDERIGRRLKLRDVSILAAVVELGTMAKAAERLAVSQPVVSKAIADLEHALGVRLLDRSHFGVQPTPYGEALVRRGSAAFDELRQCVLEIEALSDPAKGEVRVGATPQIVETLLPKVISQVHAAYPGIRVAIVQHSAVPDMYQTLRDRKIDFIVTRTGVPAGDQDLAVTKLFDEALVVVAGRHNHGLPLPRRVLKLDDLLDRLWIFAPPQSAPGILAAEMFRACELRQPAAALTTSSLALMRRLLSTGPYVAPYPRSALRLGGKQTELRVLWEATIPTQPVGIVALKGRTASPAAQVFVSCLRSVCEQAFGRSI